MAAPNSVSLSLSLSLSLLMLLSYKTLDFNVLSMHDICGSSKLQTKGHNLQLATVTNLSKK